MSQKFINYKRLDFFLNTLTKETEIFKWYNFKTFLTQEGFQRLLLDFPSIKWFEKHEGIERRYGQKPHDRYYLAYEESIHHPQENSPNRGIVKHTNLPKSWQMFLEELETSTDYKEFIKYIIKAPFFSTRYDWHIGVNNSEVSPHLDAPAKIATHIFYFNTSEDWNLSWGGETLMLEGKLNDNMNPDFSDFIKTRPVNILNNHSLLIKNTPDAWHGVKPLICPNDKYRKLFNVIFEIPEDRNQSLFYRAGLINGLLSTPQLNK
ncbi:hypothetical protein [Anabaena sp. CCY 0017]|uniref:hypothetical protein n=1 Tax=Anabaena sp. CCY 0017 TaxID=3103866 RepID=UPI0039C67E32